MKRYSIMRPFALSFFSKDLYRDVATNWKGTGFLYLFLLLVICWIPRTINYAAVFSRFATKEAPRFIDQMPTITIHDGEVTINEPMPYFINDPDSGRVIAILDTTGQTTSLEDSKAVLLLTKTKLIAKENPQQTKVYDLSQVKSCTLTKERVHHWLDIARYSVVIAILPSCVLISFVYRIVQELLYAAIGLVFVSILKVRLDYLTLLRLSVIAVTPAIILDTLRDLAGARNPAWGLICLLIALGYLWFGIKANTGEVPTQLPTDAPIPPVV